MEAVFGIVGVLVGAVVTGVVTGLREKNTWIRDARFRAYQQALMTSSDVLQSVQKLATQFEDAERFAATAKTCHENMSRFREAAQAAFLVCSYDVSDQLEAMLVFCNNSLRPLLEDRAAWADAGETNREGREWEPRRSLNFLGMGMLMKMRADLRAGVLRTVREHRHERRLIRRAKRP